MVVTKKQIADAIRTFIVDDVLPQTDDNQLGFILSIVARAMKENPSMVDGFLENPVVSSLIPGDCGRYDVSCLAEAVKDILSERGEYPVAVPKVPLLSAHDKNIMLTASDVDRILCYLSPEPEGVEAED